MEVVHDRQMNANEPAFMPPVDIIEGPSAYRLLLMLPGMEADHVELELQGRLLLVRGERRRPAMEHGEKLLVEESRHGFFARQFRLPETVEAGAVKARYEGGVLEITIPKQTPAPARRITVTGKDSS
ncbi:MAG: Hsp20/alpha crystallin family protein [Deltaproteobacteria bacterium]|nr:Hsp20/alpha crystallin family protein [Deltaproteobacteria bacterium]